MESKLDHLQSNFDQVMEDALALRERLEDAQIGKEPNNGNEDYRKLEELSLEPARLMEHSLSEECPLDKYLKAHSKGRYLVDGKRPAMADEDSTTDKANKVLLGTQAAKKKLEDNFSELMRQRNELFLHGNRSSAMNERKKTETWLVSPASRQNNAKRFKKIVDEKIKDLEKQIQKEIKDFEKPSSSDQNKEKLKKLPFSERFYVSNKLMQQNTEEKKLKTTKAAKVKSRLQKETVKKKLPPPPDTPPKSSTAYDELVMRHLYGRQPHEPHRHTIKENICPTTNTVTPKHKNIETVKPEVQNVAAPPLIQFNSRNEKFFFHTQPSNIKGDILSGEMIPVAIPLAAPCTDPAGRLPLSVIVKNNEETEEARRSPRKSKGLTRTGPNVAVITVKADDNLSSDSSSILKEKIKTKMKTRLKEKMKLARQVLPNVDIDTPEPSSISLVSPNTSNTDAVEVTQESNQESKTGSQEEVSVKDIDPKSYEFQDFVNVRDIIGREEKHVSDEGEDDDTSSSQSPIAIVGGRLEGDVRPRGPAFPPQTQRDAQQGKSDNGSHLKHVRTISTLEQEAQEWLEQQLLARMVAQMTQETSDPTVKEHADNVSHHSVESEENDSSKDWIESVIGLRGLQLFIDAGIPVDRELVSHIVRQVVTERLETLFGYPEPIAQRPTETEESAHADSYDNTRVVATPEQTPDVSTKSHTVRMNTPDKTLSELEEQSINETVESQPPSVEEEPSDLPYAVVNTPANSDVSSKKEKLSKQETPELSQIEGNESKELTFGDIMDISTPNNALSEKDLTPEPLESFEKTEDSITPTEKLNKEELKVTPVLTVEPAKPPVVATIVDSPTVDTFTQSSSTAVGLSTFAAMSVGEHLHPSQVGSDYNGSEGEFLGLPLLEEKSVEDIEDEVLQYDQETQAQHIKQMMRRLASTKKVLPELQDEITKSEGEVASMAFKSLGEITTNDLKPNEENLRRNFSSKEEDTLEQFSLTEQKDPVNRMLKKLQSNCQPRLQLTSDPSEGEVVMADTLVIPGEESNISSFGASKEPLSVGQLAGIDTSTQESTTEVIEERQTPRIITVKSVEDKKCPSPSISDGEEINSSPLNAQNVEENHKEKINVVLKLPTMEDDAEYSMDDISQYELSNTSGGEL